MYGERSSKPSAAHMSSLLHASRSDLMAAIAGLDDTAFRTRPISGAWTSAELLADLFSTERRFIDRARAAVEQEHYVVTPVSGEVREEHLGMAKRMPVPQIVHGLLAQRRSTLQWVESLTPDDLQQTLQHPARGEQSVLWQIEHVIEHELEHAREMRAGRAESETPALAPQGSAP